MARTITADQILALCPCWPSDLVIAAVGDGVTYEQIATAPVSVLSRLDRAWLLPRLATSTPTGLKILVEWAAAEAAAGAAAWAAAWAAASEWAARAANYAGEAIAVARGDYSTDGQRTETDRLYVDLAARLARAT